MIYTTRYNGSKVYRRLLLLILMNISVSSIGWAQLSTNDSLRKAISDSKDDTAKSLPLKELGELLVLRNNDSSVSLYRQALLIARKHKLIRYEAQLLAHLGGAFSFVPGTKDSAR